MQRLCSTPNPDTEINSHEFGELFLELLNLITKDVSSMFQHRCDCFVYFFLPSKILCFWITAQDHVALCFKVSTRGTYTMNFPPDSRNFDSFCMISA